MSVDPTDLAAIEAAEAEAAEAAKLAEDQEVSDLKRILSSELGRRFVRRLLDQSRVFMLSFVTGDPLTTSFNEGRRAWGNRQVALINEHYPELWQAMLKETR